MVSFTRSWIVLPEQGCCVSWSGWVHRTARLRYALAWCWSSAVAVLLIHSGKLSVNSSCLPVAHLLPPARLHVGRRVKVWVWVVVAAFVRLRAALFAFRTAAWAVPWPRLWCGCLRVNDLGLLGIRGHVSTLFLVSGMLDSVNC